MLQVFHIRNGSPMDGRHVVTITGFADDLAAPVVIKTRDEETFVLPAEYDANGFFTELYRKRFGTEIGLQRFLFEIGL